MVGQTPNDCYAIEDELGRGGMGVVYKAWDSQLQRDVADKVLPAGYTHDRQFTARL